MQKKLREIAIGAMFSNGFLLDVADCLDELEAECKAASLAMEELEAMFPGWEGYRSLADCIAVRMHDLADGTPIAKHSP